MVSSPLGAVGRCPAGAASRLTALEPAGRQALDAGYERVFGTARGVVDGSERVRGLPVGGLSYAVQYEILRPTGGARPRLLLVEAENRGSPLLLDALGDLEPGCERRAVRGHLPLVRLPHPAPRGPGLRPRAVADGDHGLRPGHAPRASAR